MTQKYIIAWIHQIESNLFLFTGKLIINQIYSNKYSSKSLEVVVTKCILLWNVAIVSLFVSASSKEWINWML